MTKHCFTSYIHRRKSRSNRGNELVTILAREEKETKEFSRVLVAVEKVPLNNRAGCCFWSSGLVLAAAWRSAHATGELCDACHPPAMVLTCLVRVQNRVSLHTSKWLVHDFVKGAVYFLKVNLCFEYVL